MNHTLIRSVVKIGAGMLASKGLIESSEAEIITGALAGVIGVIWGVLERRKKPLPIKPTLLLFALLLSIPACSTVKPNDTVASLVKIVAFNGTFAALTDEPQFRPDFVLVHSALQALETQAEIDWLDVMIILQRLPIKELKSDETRLIIGNLSLLLSDFGNSADVTQGNVREVVKALRKGIGSAL